MPFRSLGYFALGVAALALTFGAACSSSTTGSSGATGSSGTSGTAPGDDGGIPPIVDGSVPPESANTLVGLTPGGELVRVGLGADGVDTKIGFPTYKGTEIRTLNAIARGGGSIYALDQGKKADGKSLVRIDLPSLEVVPMTNDFVARVPEKEALAFAANKVYGSGQFGPVVELGLDGTLKEYILRQANSEADTTQCSTPEDLLFYGGLLAAGACAGPTATAMNASFFVWEYQLGNPGTTGQGGTLTNKSIRYKSPEKILGLGQGAGGLVATSAQGNLLALQGDTFIVVRKLAMTIGDLE